MCNICAIFYLTLFFHCYLTKLRFRDVLCHYAKISCQDTNPKNQNRNILRRDMKFLYHDSKLQNKTKIFHAAMESYITKIEIFCATTQCELCNWLKMCYFLWTDVIFGWYVFNFKLDNWRCLEIIRFFKENLALFHYSIHRFVQNFRLLYNVTTFLLISLKF